jgi:hypothetical protein
MSITITISLTFPLELFFQDGVGSVSEPLAL